MTARRAQRFAWCLFDFANSAFNTVVVTFVYAAFFAKTLVGDQDRGDVLWTWTIAASGLVVAVTAPIAGARADRSRGRRRQLVLWSLLCIACTAALFVPRVAAGAAAAGDGQLLAAMVLVATANVAFELAFVFYNSFLPQLASAHDIGRLSGYGWAFGYVGGLACLAVGLGFVGIGEATPWLPTDGDLHVRATCLLAAGWFLLFALPMFVLVRDGPSTAPSAAPASGVMHTLRQLPRRPDLLRFLVAHLVYNDALMALIAVAGLYMAGTLGMATGEVMVCAILLNVLAGIGAAAFGRLDDRVGPKAVVVASLLLLLGGGALAVAVPTRTAFFVAAGLVGIGMGPNQSASRTLLGRLVEPARAAEFFGLFALSGKATVWIGPLLFAVVRDATGSQRAAMVPLLVLFALGLWLVAGVRVQREVAP